MKKIKKIFASIGIAIIGIVFKALPVLSMSFYGGPIDESAFSAPTNKKEEIGFLEKILNVINPITTVLLTGIIFVAGIVIIFNKKLSKKVKNILAIIICILLVLMVGVLIWERI